VIKQLLETPFFAPSIALFPIDVPGTPYHRMLTLADCLDTEILAMIQRKRGEPSEQADVLAMLIHARDEDGSGMTDAELLGQTTTLLIAGHETTSNALTWTLFLLSQQPEVMSDLVDELHSTLRGDAPSFEQLNQLPLLERVIKESMRLLPPASLASRVSTAPFILGAYEMPKGAFVTWSPYITHRMPALYHEANRFLPQRWETIDPSPYEYIPFGAGPRMCIGATFAMMEIKLVLATLLQRFQLLAVPGSKVDYQMKVTLSPKYGLPMTVIRKNQPFIKHEVSGAIHRIVDLK
jgi:cytochrome P450